MQKFREQIEFITMQKGAANIEAGTEAFSVMQNASMQILETELFKVDAFSHIQSTELFAILVNSPFTMEARARIVEMINDKTSALTSNRSNVARVSLDHL